MTTKTKTIASIVLGVLAVAGWAAHWHLTINNTAQAKAPSVLHKPMTTEQCYMAAQIRPSWSEAQNIYGWASSEYGKEYILVYSIDNDRACTLSYWHTDNHPSQVSLDLR